MLENANILLRLPIGIGGSSAVKLDIANCPV